MGLKALGISWFVAALVAFPVTVQAADERAADDESADVEVRATTAAEFAQLRTQIEGEMGRDGLYEGVTRGQRRELNALFDRMESTLARAENVDSLSPDRQVALFNDQDRVNALLTQARDSDRQICRRETQLGSNMRTTVCRTKAEWDREREDSREAIRRMQRDQGRPGG